DRGDPLREHAPAGHGRQARRFRPAGRAPLLAARRARTGRSRADARPRLAPVPRAPCRGTRAVPAGALPGARRRPGADVRLRPNARLRRARPTTNAVGPPGYGGASGRRTVNVLPTPSSPSTATVPPCCSTIWRTL